MTTIQRAYKTKDVDMLITASTIVQSAIANKTFLQSKRSTWTDSFFNDLQEEIDTAIQNHLGVDTAKTLRMSTLVVANIQSAALKDLAEIKVQLVEDFKENPSYKTEIMSQLGFIRHHKEAQNGDQESLINLLYQFKTNLSASLRAEIVAKGISNAVLNTIIGYADTLKSADITQESAKGTRKVITAEAITEFNSIYNKVVSISKISNKFYKDNAALKEQFSFTKVSKTLNTFKKTKKATVEL